MDVTFSNKSLFTLCTNEKKRARKLGHQRAEELKIALDELHAATNLAEIASLPHRRLHGLKGDQTGRYSIDIDKQYRIWFEISDDEELRNADGSLDFSEVTAINITRIGDPHD